MGVFYFPCDFVYWRKIPNHDKFKKELLKIIENTDKNCKLHPIITNGKTSHGVHIVNNEITKRVEMVNSVLWDTLDEAIKDLRDKNPHLSKIKKSKILNLFYTKYEKDAYVSAHNHMANCQYLTHTINDEKFFPTFTLIYIVNDNNKRNQTVFFQPSMVGNTTSEAQENRFSTSEVEEISEGTVLLFPMSLYHEVKKIEIAGRIILSFNIVSTFYR
jgi:hypothetical protein